MSRGKSHDERFAEMTFASVYPLYLTKVERKGRTQAELNQVIQWLTGFSEQEMDDLIAEKSNFAIFFEKQNFTRMHQKSLARFVGTG